MMEVHFFLVPPKEVSRRAVALAKRILATRSDWFTDNRKYFFHITLFGTSISQSNFKNQVEEATGFTHLVKPFALEVNGFWMDHNGYLVLNISNDNRLAIFRNQFVKTLRGSSKKILQPTLPYRPHITLTRLKLKSSRKFRELPTTRFSFRASVVGIGAKGKHGAVLKVFKRIKLK